MCTEPCEPALARAGFCLETVAQLNNVLPVDGELNPPVEFRFFCELEQRVMNPMIDAIHDASTNQGGL